MGFRIQSVFICSCAFVVVFYSSMLYYDSNIFKYIRERFSRVDSLLMFTKGETLSKTDVAPIYDGEYMHSRRATCPDLPVPDVIIYNNMWQPVSNSKQLFLYSSFIDGDKIRLIAIGKRKVDSLTCQIWSRNTYLNTVVVDKYLAKLEKFFAGDVHGHSVATLYVDCPLPTYGVPYAVSIAAGNLTCKAANNSFLLQTSGKAKQGYFSVCVPPVHTSVYPTPHHLIQWIATNKLLGVKFTFYNAGLHPNSVLWNVFETYVKEQIIEILQRNIPTTEIHYFGQVASMADCLYRHSKKLYYTAFFDLDELIIPRIPEDMTWSDMLTRLPDACSYSFQSAYFENNFTNVSYSKLSRDFIFNQAFVVKSVKRQSHIFKQGYRSKVIVKPEEVQRFGIHQTLKCKGDKVIRHVDPAIGMLHHYRFNTTYTDVIDNTTLKYMTSIRKQLEKSPI